MTDLKFNIKSYSFEDTRKIGKSLALLMRRGDVVLLCGDLGAGKTQFVKGVAATLKVNDNVVSPTFIIAVVYKGEINLIHIDAYRLESFYEVMDLGLDEDFLHAVTVIEWGNRVADFLQDVFMTITFELGDDDNTRDIEVMCHDKNRNQAVLKALEELALTINVK